MPDKNRTPLSDMVADRLGVDRELMITHIAYEGIEVKVCVVCGAFNEPNGEYCKKCNIYLWNDPQVETVQIKIPRFNEEEIDRRLAHLQEMADDGDEKATEWLEVLKPFHKNRRNREAWDNPQAQSLLRKKRGCEK